MDGGFRCPGAPEEAEHDEGTGGAGGGETTRAGVFCPCFVLRAGPDVDVLEEI